MQTRAQKLVEEFGDTDVKKYLASCTSRQQEAFRIRLKGLSVDEAGEQLGVKGPAIRSLEAQAAKRIIACIARGSVIPVANYSVRARRIGMELKDPETHDQTVEKIVAALTENSGNITRAADDLGVSARSLWDWVNAYDDIETALAEIREEEGVEHWIGDPAYAKGAG